MMFVGGHDILYDFTRYLSVFFVSLLSILGVNEMLSKVFHDVTTA